MGYKRNTRNTRYTRKYTRRNKYPRRRYTRQYNNRNYKNTYKRALEDMNYDVYKIDKQIVYRKYIDDQIKRKIKSL